MTKQREPETLELWAVVDKKTGKVQHPAGTGPVLWGSERAAQNYIGRNKNLAARKVRVTVEVVEE